MGLSSCRCASSADPATLLEAAPDDLVEALATLRPADVRPLTTALAALALSRCATESQALLGVWPALRLSEHVDRSRVLAPLIHSAVRIRRQAASAPFQLPDLPDQAGPTDVQLLQEALGHDDLPAAEAQLAGLLARDDPLSAQLVVAWYSCREYGHHGHNAALASAARRLIANGATTQLLRAPIHAMVAHRRADPRVKPSRITQVARDDASISLTIAAATALGAAELAGPWPEELHLYLAADSIEDLSDWIASQGRDAQARMMRARGLDWMDAWWRGKSSYPRPRPAPAHTVVLPDGTQQALDWLMDAAAAGSTTDVSAGLADWGSRPLPPLQSLLAEASLATSVRSGGHATQVAVSVAERAHPAELSLCAPMLVAAARETEADYEVIAAALRTPGYPFRGR